VHKGDELRTAHDVASSPQWPDRDRATYDHCWRKRLPRGARKRNRAQRSDAAAFFAPSTYLAYERAVVRGLTAATARSPRRLNQHPTSRRRKHTMFTILNGSRLNGSRIAIAIITLGIVAGATELANAETWNQAHPRRAEVNARLNNQNQRINQERREGEITAGQARALHAQDRFIRREERFEARQNGGHITRSEQRSLNQQENAVSKEIGR
jgi:hypothetical protein